MFPTTLDPRRTSVSVRSFVSMIRQHSALTLLMALKSVQTVEGAQRIYFAERDGKNRPTVLRAAARRIEELGGTEPEHHLTLVVAAETVDRNRGQHG